MIFKHYSTHITVTPHKQIGLPSAMEWYRFQSIKIEIAHYKDHKGSYRWPGMRELVTWLRHGNPESLPDITIWFDEVGGPKTDGDEKWTERVKAETVFQWRPNEDAYGGGEKLWSYYWAPWEDVSDEEVSDNESDDARSLTRPDDTTDDEHEPDPYAGDYWIDEPFFVSKNTLCDRWLQITGDNYGNPIAIEILDYFLELLLCKSGKIHTLGGLRSRRALIEQYDPQRRISDKDYMIDLCKALRLWLTGDRDGIKLPDGVGKKYGAPRLEQIAYQARGQNDDWYWYCGTVWEAEGRTEWKAKKAEGELLHDLVSTSQATEMS